MKKVWVIGGIVLIILVALGTAWYVRHLKQIESQQSTEVPVQEEKNREPDPEFLHDQDRDGLSDEQELELGTDDLEVDSDGDGLSDYYEVNELGTDPTKFDTDGDGFADAVELINGYNPNGDGLLD